MPVLSGSVDYPWANPRPTTDAILGYVSRTKDRRFWIVERSGSILPVAYCSAEQAGQAVFQMEPTA